MNADRRSVAARARIHSALGDEARLSIVDLLRLGDLSPGEIGASLGMPTNLLAHHIKILRREGLVAHARSEGDRRRTYLRLTDVVPADPHAVPALTARRVVFVCTRNSARSQLASAIWNNAGQVPSLSAGTDPARHVHDAAANAALRHGLHLNGNGTKHVAKVARHGDLLVAVCDNAHEQLQTTTLTRLHWSVPDPVPVGTEAAFDLTMADLTARISHLVPALTRST